MQRNVKRGLEWTARISGKVGPFFALIVVLAIFGSIEPARFFDLQNLANVAVHDEEVIRPLTRPFSDRPPIEREAINIHEVLVAIF